MSVLEAGIGWLAPSLCVGCGAEGSALCNGCFTSEILPFGERCWRCSSVSVNCRTCISCRGSSSPRFVWITTNYEHTAQRLVQSYKFGQLRAAANSIAELMCDNLLSFNSDDEITRLNYLIVPIPTATSRIRQRSFDHSELLAKAVARRLGLKHQNLLGRLGQGRQVGASRAKRLNQQAESYYVKKPDKSSGRNILLIDDVVTTGATLQSATKALRQAGAKRVDALVFAKRL